MTNKNNKSEEKQKEEKGNGKFLKSFLLITLLFIFGVYLVMQSRPDLIENVYPNKTANTNSSEADKKLVQEAIDDSYSVGPEPPMQLFDNAEENKPVDNVIQQDLSQELESLDDNNKQSDSEDTEMDKEEEVNPYHEIVDKEAKAFNSSALKSKFNDYRMFISNANRLIEKYKLGESFLPELKIFKEHIHPSYINETIKLLESYNALLENDSLDNAEENKSDSVQVKLLEKFVKIKKIEPVDAKLVKVKSDIDKRLEVFTNYIYSQKLQDSLVK